MAFPSNTDREAALLAPYAMHSSASLGRCYAEPTHPYRGPYQRDRDRILHSGAFRRLSHKTQVFTGEMGDYHRTRLTHTLEVASIARTVARALRFNEDLVEALALAHDLGHPPFGHSGEEVLDQRLRDHGGFNHNQQGLRICELLESRYPSFPGLNLTLEVLEGQRHRARKRGTSSCGNDASEGRVLSPLLEVQLVDAADSIAYDAHDADDALELGLINLEQLLEVPLWLDARERVTERFGQLEGRPLRRAVVHELIDMQVGDLLEATMSNIANQPIVNVADARRCPVVVCQSDKMGRRKKVLERFLFQHVYRHPEVLAKRGIAQRALAEMYDYLVSHPDQLPSKFSQLALRDGVSRATADYIAGMTDRFAFDERDRLLSP